MKKMFANIKFSLKKKEKTDESTQETIVKLKN